ncbi:MAG TPA: hypothetical protein VLA13_04045 [Massilibacterium sp.]|nr:hypothetical protein [Massilibacterium sp.]
MTIYDKLVNNYETYDRKDKKKDIRITSEEKRKFEELKSQGVDVVQVLRAVVNHLYDLKTKEKEE